MDKLWAPWRISYIKKSDKAKKGCLFCKVAKEKADKKNLVVLRCAHTFCILNKFPYNNGHLMVCPYRHIKNFGDLKNCEIVDLFATLNRVQSILKKMLKPDGFNIGANIASSAGAGIPNHLHLHVVPRWKEDTNFMPVIFNTKIISQSLQELYAQLHRRIRK